MVATAPAAEDIKAIFRSADKACNGQISTGAFHTVLTYLPWRLGALEVPRLSKVVRSTLSCDAPDSPFWKFLCQCVCQESRLYLPRDPTGGLVAVGDGPWRELFRDLLRLRCRFAPAGEGEAVAGISPDECIRLAAFCRVRPSRPVQTEEEVAPAAKISANLFPLHQRVALLRQRRPELSHKQAMQLLMQRPDSADASTEASNDEAEETTQGRGGDDGFTASVLSVTPGVAGSLLTVSPGIGYRSWAFDHVFATDASQHQVHHRCGTHHVVDLMNGISGSLIVYGQTGSGKTHTMFGPPKLGDQALASGVESCEGLVPSMASDILDAVKARQEAGFEVQLGASYIEVFGNDLRDLLGGDLGVNRSQAQRIGHKLILNGECEVPIPDREALADLLRRGEEHKRQASTAMNERSSRAHTLVIFRLRQRAFEQITFVESSLSLVDLGGSERVSKSKANENLRCPGTVKAGEEESEKVSWQEYYSSRQRITETSNINKGLLTLKRCIQALLTRQKHDPQSGREPQRVPFYDSRLTQLLEPALGSFSRTSVLVCCSGEDVHAEETVQTLRFGKLCSSVEQKEGQAGPQDMNEAVTQALQQLDAEIKEVEAAIRQKERWEWRRTTKQHIIDEKDTGGTVCHKDETMELGGLGAVEIQADVGTSSKQEVEHEVWGQVLEGAEVENARREELLCRRQRLLGGSCTADNV